MKNNKKRTAVIATVVAFLLVLTGTFAWKSLSQQVVNENSGENAAGGRVHDDYNKESGNKDIYAENYSKQNLIARIKLSEYIENNGKSLLDGGQKDDKSTWAPYTLGNKSVFRDYVTWNLGGQKVYLPTFNTDSSNLSIDASGDAIDVLTSKATARGDGNQGDFVLDTKYAFDPDEDKLETKQDPDFPDDPSKTIEIEKHTAANTLTQAQAPISMEDWQKLPAEEQKGNFWVIDTDGWAYWANILAPGQTTSLLLDQLNWNSDSVSELDKWYYGIDVEGEFVSPIDKDKFPNSEHGAPSKAATTLINNLAAEKLVYALNFTTDVSNLTMQGGASQQFGAQVNQIGTSGSVTDAKASDITWTISPSTAGTVDETGKVTLADLTENTKITVTATSPSLNASDSFVIKGSPKK